LIALDRAAVASSLIVGNLEKLAMQRERCRRAMMDRLSEEIGRSPPAIPRLAGRMNQGMLRLLAGTPDPPRTANA
jgi:hypothetical protein